MSAAKITAQAAVLLSNDVPKAIDFWVKNVGFELTGAWGNPVDFAILRRNEARVMIGGAPPEHQITPLWKIRDNLWNAYFWVDDARALFTELSACGAKIDYELCTQPYGVLEFGIQDPDGHDIGFGETLTGKTAD